MSDDVDWSGIMEELRAEPTQAGMPPRRKKHTYWYHVVAVFAEGTAERLVASRRSRKTAEHEATHLRHLRPAARAGANKKQRYVVRRSTDPNRWYSKGMTVTHSDPSLATRTARPRKRSR